MSVGDGGGGGGVKGAIGASSCCGRSVVCVWV